MNSVVVLVDASRGATRAQTTPVVLADAGVENVNAEVDDLITTGVLRRVLAFTELKFSNSMIEASAPPSCPLSTDSRLVHSGRPTRRLSSAKRGSELRLSITPGRFNITRRVERSATALSSHLNARSFSLRPTYTTAMS